MDWIAALALAGLVQSAPRGAQPPSQAPAGSPPAASGSSPAAAQAAAELARQIARGKVVFAEQKCASCHVVAGAGNPRSPLDGVGSRLKAADVRLWIVAPRKLKPTVRKPDYSKVPPADLDALVAYIMSLTKP